MYNEIFFGNIESFASNFIIIVQISNIQKHLCTIGVSQTLGSRKDESFWDERSTARMEIILQKLYQYEH